MSPADILQRFVATIHEGRTYMQAPFSRDGFIYATNGHIAVRIPHSDGIDASEHDKIQSIRELFENNIRDSFVDFPSLPDPVICKVCSGRRVAYKCENCDGNGEFEHRGRLYDCKECDGFGNVNEGHENDKEPCFFCDGTGHEKQSVPVGDSLFDRRYLAKIIDLPGIRFAPNPEWALGVAYFTFDGGEGLLMPMRQ